MEMSLRRTGGRGVRLPVRGRGRGEFIRQTGSPDRYGVIVLALEPAGLGGNCPLSREVTEEAIPVMFLEAVLRAIDHVVAEDGFEGDYLNGCRIRVVDGGYNETDSKVSCYQMATVMAMREAGIGLYEPVPGKDL